jgi:hypothetical protein
MPKKQITRIMTRKKRNSHSGGAASYQKVRTKPANRRETRSKALGRMFKDFQNLFTRKQKIKPVSYENIGKSSPFELVISSNSNREASPFVIVDVPKPYTSRHSKVSPRPNNADFMSPVPDGRGFKKKRTKRHLK